jgi:phosphatidate cytidylyltransferase
MSFNWKTFRTRSLTAIVFVIVMLTGLLWNQWSFLLLFSIIHFGCWWEFLRLSEKINTVSYHTYVKLGFMLLGYGVMLWFCEPPFSIGSYSLKENFSLPFSIAGFILLMTGMFQKMRVDIKSFGWAALGLIYISLSWGLMMKLYGSMDLYLHDTTFVFGAYVLPVVTIASVWINDTMAYIVGSMIGKTPLSKISPKKTWEGTIGGIILCIVVVGLLSTWLITGSLEKAGIVLFSILAAVAAVSGTLGDLFESKLKRMAGVKDSGHIMPGHGGFLDRFDSLLFAVIAVSIVLALVKVTLN